MAGYTNDFSGAECEFHIDSPDVAKIIRRANRRRQVVTLQLDGDELEAALWGLENYRKNGNGNGHGG